VTDEPRIVLYVEVDDVPWRKCPGAWSVAGVFRLLEDARLLGLVFSVYCSPRTLTAYPSFADFVAGEGQRILSSPTPALNLAWPTTSGEGVWWIKLKPDADARSIRKKVDRLARKGWRLA